MFIPLLAIFALPVIGVGDAAAIPEAVHVANSHTCRRSHLQACKPFPEWHR